MKRFVVFRNPGQNWMKDMPTREQPLWDEHAAFMDNLFDSGTVFLGGPFADHNGALVILNAASEAAARAMLRDDPWEIHDIQITVSVREWLIFLDSTEKQSG